MADPLIAVRKLTKTYDRAGRRVVALDAIDLAVARGEYVALVGPSGSGKTTLLNLLGGIDSPTSGQVVYDARDLGDLRESQLARWRLAHVGYVFQDFRLVSGLSTLENVQLPLYLSGQLDGMETRARALLEELGMADRASHYPAELSRGEEQRVAIARGLAGGPDLLLVDEPTGNLDAGATEAVRELLRSHHVRDGMTIVMSTHDPAIASDSDRQVRMAFGRIATGHRTGNTPT